MAPHIEAGQTGDDPHGEKSRIALTSVLAAMFITGLKLVVGIETNSLGILSEAAHSGLDFLAALLTYVAVRIAALPAGQGAPVRSREDRESLGVHRDHVARDHLWVDHL